MQEVSSPPTAAALMESTRSIGYSFDSAVADIIDNSISAEASHVWIYSIPSSDPAVSILDDGYGMSADKLREAMRYGTDPNLERDVNDLGRFGLGMKMASLSQCRRLTVISKHQGEVNACRWDLDRVRETNDWTLQILSLDEVSDMRLISELKNMNSGTLVVWENLDKELERAIDIRDSMTECLISCKKHLSLVFHRYIDSNYGGNLTLIFNGVEIEPLDPFLSRNTKTSHMPRQAVNINGQNVWIDPYVLPPESSLSKKDVELLGGLQRNMQGFWVYRNKRLIIPGTWFRLTGNKELTKLARVMVDVPNTLDSIWNIDVKKSSATVPAPFRKEFESVLERILSKSETKYRYRGRKESSGAKQFIWDKIRDNGVVSYSINREHPLIKQGLDELDSEERAWALRVFDLIENNVPYQDIYVTLADNNLSKSEKKDDIEQIVKDGIFLMQRGISLETLKNIEPFLGNEEVIKELRMYVGE